MPVGPTLRLPNLSLMMTKVTILRMRRRAIRAEMQAAVRLQGLVPPLPSLRSMMMTSMPRLRIAVMRRRTNHDEMLGSVMLRGPGASLVEPPGTFALTGMPEAREREPETVGKLFGDWRPSMTVRDR